MSNIDKQADSVSRIIADLKLKHGSGDTYAPIMRWDELMALLDELEAVQKASAARLGAIDTTHKIFQRERARAEAAERRIADYQELISGLVGVSSSILREVERINNASAAGKGE